MTTNSNFFELSKEISNNFLQNIVFIDDRAYQQEDSKNNHEFDALKVTQAFAKERKICAVFKPETTDDIDNLALLAKKADITVIDWQINLLEDVQEDDDEEDSEDDDPRGPHTRKIICEILSDPLMGKGSLKLIVVYTAEIDLQGIAAYIHSDLEAIQLDSKLDNCSISTDNIKILVISKPSVGEGEQEDKFKHNPELKDKIISYSELPNFVLTEFTNMTSGLLSNFILQSLTVLRVNTFRLIKLYNNKLDPSFLSHRFLLPNQEDSQDQLVEMLSHSIQALLSYNQSDNSVVIDNIEAWLDQFKFDNQLALSKKNIDLDNKYLKSWLSKGTERALLDYWLEKEYEAISDGTKRDKLVRNFEEKIHKKGSSYLTKPGEEDDSEKRDSEYSLLTHHKSNLRQISHVPKLSLGTIVKKKDGGIFYLCIQAKCDSTRVEKERKFLFLPFQKQEGDKKFHIVVEDDDSIIKLQIIKSAYALKTIKFIPPNDDNSIMAINMGDSFIFSSTYNEHFQWICDLKDAHAQRISSNYAAQLSRIGLDESEWLRRWAGN